MSLQLADCLWVRGLSTVNPHWRSLFDHLRAAGAEIVELGGNKAANDIDQVSRLILDSPRHLILHDLMARELGPLKALLHRRGNYSMVLVDWWRVDPWFTSRADRLFYTFFNGLAVRRGEGSFIDPVPVNVWPRADRRAWFSIACAALRGPALLAAPVLEAAQRRARRAAEGKTPPLFYFPFPIVGGELPLQQEEPEHDFSNMGATTGCWRICDPFAPARWNFANLYADRQFIIDQLLGAAGAGFKIFDKRRAGHLSWADFCRAIGRSRYVISTGGLQRASVPKFIEFPCMGTPMLGISPTHEYPWLDQCLHPIDLHRADHDQFREQLANARDAFPRLKQSCMGLRESLLKLYSAESCFRAVQAQLDGEGVPPGYLRPGADQLIG